MTSRDNCQFCPVDDDSPKLCCPPEGGAPGRGGGRDGRSENRLPNSNSYAMVTSQDPVNRGYTGVNFMSSNAMKFFQ